MTAVCGAGQREICGVDNPNDLNDEHQKRKYAPLNSACIACGSENENGLRLRFTLDAGRAIAEWQCSEHGRASVGSFTAASSPPFSTRRCRRQSLLRIVRR
jgi:hypothetical protein